MTLKFDRENKKEFNMLDVKGNMYTDRVYSELKKHHIDFAVGVPCGVQRHIIYNISHDPDIYHIPATREAEAIGIAAGAYLAGRKPLVYMQNSGLFDCSNDIASLLIMYKIPIFLSVTWRGCPGEDAPHHFVTGKATKSLLESFDIPYKVLKKNNIENDISELFEKMKEKKVPAALLIQRGWYL